MLRTLTIFLLAATAHAAIHLEASTCASGSTSTVTTSAIDGTAGTNHLIVIFEVRFTTLATPTDSTSANTYTKLNTVTNSSTLHAIYYAENATVSSTQTFTIPNGVATFPAICVMIFSGVATASSFDQQSTGGTNNGTSVQPGASGLPSQDNELVVSGLAFAASITGTAVATPTMTITNTAAYSAGNNFGQSAAYYIQTSAASVNPTWSWSTGSQVNCSIATFKPALPKIVHRTPQQ